MHKMRDMPVIKMERNTMTKYGCTLLWRGQALDISPPGGSNDTRDITILVSVEEL